MAEIIALFIVCKNIGVMARARGIKARPFQHRAILLWIVFELQFAFVAGLIGFQGIFIYLAGYVGALLSIRLSYNAVRSAGPPTPTPDEPSI